MFYALPHEPPPPLVLQDAVLVALPFCSIVFPEFQCWVPAHSLFSIGLPGEDFLLLLFFLFRLSVPALQL